MIPRLYAYLIACAIVISLFVGGYYYAYDNGYDAKEFEVREMQNKADKEAREKYELVASELETLKNKRQENARTITKVVEKIVERPVYSNQCVDADGLQLANDAIQGRSSSIPKTEVQPNPEP